MLFRINVSLTEDDYFAFNQFHSIESKAGKKQLKKTRNMFVICIAIMVLGVFMLNDLTYSITFAAVVSFFSIVYLLFFKRLMKMSIKMQLKQMKKIGKLPFDSTAVIEFYEDRFAESTDSRRTEQTYASLDRICILKERYVILYMDSVRAYIFPVPQLKMQIDQEAFLDFILQKCNKVEYY